MLTLPTGVTPTGLAAVGNKVFIANNNNYSITNEDSVTVINLKTQSIKTIHDASFDEPYTVTIHKHKAYVTNSNGSTISVIDTKCNKVVNVLTGFDGPSGMVITNKGIGYVNNYGGPILGSGNGHTVSVVDIRNNSIISTIEVGLAPAAVALSPNQKFVYVINYVDGNPGTGTLQAIKTSTGTVDKFLTGLFGPFGISITPAGTLAYISNFGSNNFSPFGKTVSVVDLCKFKIIYTIDVGIQPAGVAVSCDGKFVYVTNYNTLYASPNFTNLTPGQGLVAVIDTCKQKVVRWIAVNQAPANIICYNKQLIVTNFISNTVNIITSVE